MHPNTGSPELDMLITSAASWLDDAVRAWLDSKPAKVAVLAPIAVEHLGKAVLWSIHPTLLVPLEANAESSLAVLAGRPTLLEPKLRTIGLRQVLVRLDRLMLRDLLSGTRRSRMIDARNGAVHVGTGSESRGLLIDALSICELLLDELGIDSADFYGSRAQSVSQLLDEKQSEVGLRVAEARARARQRIDGLQEQIGEQVYLEVASSLEAERTYTLEPRDFGPDLEAIDHTCPECGSTGRLFGHVDVSAEADVEVEPLGGGRYEPVVTGYWEISFRSSTFACAVCELVLYGTDELSEAGMPTARMNVSESDLGDEFSAEDFAGSW